MQAMNDRAAEGRPPERRQRRSPYLGDALRFQLDACREDEGLAAIVVSDELGFCVAHSGGDGDHEELAAQLPILASPRARARREADGDEGTFPWVATLVVKTFDASGTRLHACVVGSPGASLDNGASDEARGGAVLDRVASGFSRLLGD